MAEEEKEVTNENAEASSKSGKKVLFIVLGLVALLLLIGVPAAYFALSGEKPPQEESISEIENMNNIPNYETEGENDEEEWDEDEDPLGAIFPMDTFIVNLPGAKRFFRCQVQFEFFSREIPRRFYVRIVPIRDEILKLLSVRTVNELTSTEGKEQLKLDLKKVVNELLRKEEVKHVYFTQFVIQ